MIGQEVKFWRNEKNMTGAKLAQLADMSAGMLTKIEKGQVSPSINTLVAISDALNIPVSMFFYRIEKSRYVSFVPAGEGLAVDKRGTRAGHIYEMLGHNIGHTIGIEPFIVKIDKHSEPYSMFQEEGFKFVYMMTGEIEFRHGERLFPLKPGDALTFDAMAPHGPEKLTDVPASFLSIAVYSRFDPGLR
jgi:transcriptional regulator with XRE-family HTH domain